MPEYLVESGMHKKKFIADDAHGAAMALLKDAKLRGLAHVVTVKDGNDADDLYFFTGHLIDEMGVFKRGPRLEENETNEKQS